MWSIVSQLLGNLWNKVMDASFFKACCQSGFKLDKLFQVWQQWKQFTGRNTPLESMLLTLCTVLQLTKIVRDSPCKSVNLSHVKYHFTWPMCLLVIKQAAVWKNVLHNFVYFQSFLFFNFMHGMPHSTLTLTRFFLPSGINGHHALTIKESIDFGVGLSI